MSAPRLRLAQLALFLALGACREQWVPATRGSAPETVEKQGQPPAPPLDAGLPVEAAPPTDSSVDEATLGSFSLDLVEHAKSCTLRFRGGSGGPPKGELVLSVTPPCRFVRKPPGQYAGGCGVRSYVYDDIHATVALVVGNQDASDHEASPMPTGVDACTKQPCGHAYQGLLLGPQVVSLPLHTTRHATCPSNGPDEKDFWLISHPP